MRLGGRKSAAVEEGEEVAAVEEGDVVSRSAGSGGGHEVRLRARGSGMNQGAKKKSKGTAQRSRREVHGSDYKEASGDSGGLCGGGVGAMFMDSGELQSGHSGRVDVYLHEVPVRERGEVA